MNQQVKVSDGKERFDNTSFSNIIEDGKSLPLFATYTCPICAEQIGFTKKDFEERSLNNYSNLSKENQILFSKSAREGQFDNLHFLDWYCPKCKIPVRVYVEHWAGGRHGDAGVNIRFTLELF